MRKAAIRTKNKFKKQFFSKNPDRFNVIGIGCSTSFDEENDTIKEFDFYIKVYLFDMEDIIYLNLPAEINKFPIKYLLTKEEK